MLLAGRNRGVASSMSSLPISDLNLFLAEGHVTPTAVRSCDTQTESQTDTEAHAFPNALADP